MARVCRSGGRIAMANWTPESLVGQMFKVLGRHVPPPSGVRPPSLWGTESYLQELFGDNAASIHARRRFFNMRYRSAAHFLDVFRTWYGPVHKAFASLQHDQATALEFDLTDLLIRMNQSAPRGLVIPSEYLEVVIVRA